MYDSDPLVWQERGVVEYNRGAFEDAISYFNHALDLIGAQDETTLPHWLTAVCNLGQAQRRLLRLSDARISFEKVLEHDPIHVDAKLALAYVCHLEGNLDDAILLYHEVCDLPRCYRV